MSTNCISTFYGWAPIQFLPHRFLLSSSTDRRRGRQQPSSTRSRQATEGRRNWRPERRLRRDQQECQNLHHLLIGGVDPYSSITILVWIEYIRFNVIRLSSSQLCMISCLLVESNLCTSFASWISISPLFPNFSNYMYPYDYVLDTIVLYAESVKI